MLSAKMLNVKEALCEFERIADLARQVVYKQEYLLRSRGWAHTCENPRSVWMWEKKIGTKIYHMAMSDALEIEQRICEANNV